MSMRKRESADNRRIEAARRVRKMLGLRYGDNKRTLVELPLNDRQFVVIGDARPENMRVSELQIEYDLAVRVLDAEGLITIGSGRIATGVSKDRLEMLPISYDGAGMFWWLKVSPVDDVPTAIRDEALSFVDQALAKRTWGDENDPQTEARSVLSSVSGRYAVLPDNSILTGSKSPGLRFVDRGEWLTFEIFDRLSESVEKSETLDLAARDQLPLIFGILEYAAADEFLALVAERNPDRRVTKESLAERRHAEWTKDFTHNRDRWADASFFNEFVSVLNQHIGAMRPVGHKQLDEAFKPLLFGVKTWLHDHDATNAKLDKILEFRNILLDIEPNFDDLLAERLKWPHKVKPLEVLEIRARGLKALIAEPAFSPSP